MRIRTPEYGKRGQALLMVTLALFAMAGALGLAVDLGWSYFTKKSAQAAADAAAMAAVQQAYLSERADDDNTTYECATEAACQTVTPCPPNPPRPPANNIQNGCLYAMTNGFRSEGRQTVTLEANNTTPPPTAPGVYSYYWVTARVAESIPQLFSAIMGNTTSLTSARATAAIVDSAVMGSLILLNRENDCVPMDNGGNNACGVNLLVQANDNQGLDAVRADGGILMASTKRGAAADRRYAGENQGGGTVRSPFTFIRGAGDVTLGGSSQWIESPRNGLGDRAYFQDPMRGKGQPPPPPAGLMDRPVADAVLVGSNDPNNPRILLPGNYYSVDSRTGRATGDQIVVTGHIRFASGGAGFGEYVIFGGLQNSSAGTTLTFEPGRYVFAGVKSRNNSVGVLFDIDRNMTVVDQSPARERNSDPGEIFIFTDAKYPGLQVPAAIRSVTGLVDDLSHGIAGFHTGNNAEVLINLHGLNVDHPALPAGLKPFAPVVIWQDQRNSVIKYTPNGFIDNSCGNVDRLAGCPNTDLRDARSTELFFQASPNLSIYGVAYQPRGAFTVMQGGGGYSSPLQIIAGSLAVRGNSNVRLASINNPLFSQIVALVE